MSHSWPDLSSLHLFLLVVEYGSIGRAAHHTGLTQASASRRLDTLERELGLSLLVRDTTGSRLTPQGQTVADWAQTVVNSAGDLLEGVSALRRHRNATVGVAASMTVAEYLVPSWLATLRRSHPEVEVGLQVVNSAEVVERVRSGTVALGFIESPDVPHDTALRRLARDRLVLVVAPEHRWTRRRGPIPARELAQTPLVTRERGSGTRTALDRMLADVGLFPEPAELELSSNAAVKVAVRGGAAPAVLSATAVEEETASGRLVEIPVSGIGLERSLHAVWRKRQRLNGPEAELVRIAAG